MFRILRLALFGLVVLIALAPVAWSAPAPVAIGAQLPDAPLNPLFNGSGSLGNFRGKPLLINVWASWCPPCRQEMGSLQKLARNYDGKQFNIIGISTDDDRDAALAYLKRAGISFRNYIDQRLALETLLGADRLPLTVLVDSDGKVIKRIYGSRDWNSPEAANLISQAFRLKSR